MDKNVVLVKVRFLDQVRSITCRVGDLRLHYGQKVLAHSDRGLAVGVVHSFPFTSLDSSEIENARKILKIASDEDEEECKRIYQKQRRAGQVFKELVTHHGLDMVLDHFKFTAGGRKITFYYRSRERVDFRELLKSLKKSFTESLELIQISPDTKFHTNRIGPCGMELCLFINSTRNDSSVSGTRCSENKCCLDVDDPFYEDRYSRLPKKGEYIQTKTQEVGRVIKIDPIREEFDLLTASGVLKRYISDMFTSTLDKDDVVFPPHFESIADETKTVIGLAELQKTKASLIAKEELEMKKRSQEFAQRSIEQFFEKNS